MNAGDRGLVDELQLRADSRPRPAAILLALTRPVLLVGVGTWQTQPAPISPRSMHAPSSRAARHGARLNVSAVGPGRGARGCPGRALTQPAVLAMIKRAVRGEAGDVDLPLGNRHSDPDPGEEEAAEAARLSDARHGVGATGDR